MKVKISFTLVLISLFGAVSISQAQEQPEILNGIVMDLQSNRPLSAVIVTNLSTKMEVQTEAAGNFSIPARVNDLIQFYYPGYRIDTLLVIEFDLKRVYLTTSGETIRIDEITVRAISDEQLDMEIENAEKQGQFTEYSTDRGGFRISPSRLFGQAGRQARQRYDMLLAEKERRVIDRRFSVEAIQALTPLKDRDLSLFMIKYRPKTEFARTASQETFNVYIMDAYSDFKKLSPEEKAAIIDQK